MQSVKLHSHIGSDGILRLNVPLDLRDTPLEVVIVIQPLTPAQNSGWPPDFFEKTAGAWQGEPLVRAEQSEYETREELL